MSAFETQLPSELEKLMRENRVPHAVALEGGDQEALNKASMRLSMWAVCKSAADKPCLQCKACQKMKSGNHPDVYTARTEGKKNAVKISEIRAICADSVYKPNESDCKVYIIPSADKMEAAPQNAFLKLMEEPPQPMLFILLCENSAGLLQTIRSRCSVFKIDGSGSDSETQALACEIAQALCKSKEIQLVYACAALDERQKALKALDALSEIVRAATVYSITGRADGENNLVRELSINIKKRGLVRIQSVIAESKEYINRNVGLTLVSAALSVNLKYSKYL